MVFITPYKKIEEFSIGERVDSPHTRSGFSVKIIPSVFFEFTDAQVVIFNGKGFTSHQVRPSPEDMKSYLEFMHKLMLHLDIDDEKTPLEVFAKIDKHDSTCLRPLLSKKLNNDPSTETLLHSGRGSTWYVKISFSSFWYDMDQNLSKAQLYIWNLISPAEESFVSGWRKSSKLALTIDTEEH